MKLSTRWQQWWVKGREEWQFHCDPLLEGGEQIRLTAPDGHELVIEAPAGRFVKLHIAISWEERGSLFAQKE